MNFQSPEDFKYVTGDLSAIEIDNDIMPVRYGDAKRAIRGMDIAFLMEAVEERARAYDLSGRTFNFTKNLSLQQLNSVIARYNQIVEKQRQMVEYNLNNPGWLYGWIDPLSADDFLAQPLYQESRGDPITNAPPWPKFPSLSCDLLPASGHSIELSTVQALFDAVGSMQTLSQPNPTGLTPPASIWRIDVTDTGGSGMGVFVIHSIGTIADLTQARQQAIDQLAQGPDYMYTIRVGDSCGTGVTDGVFNSLSASMAAVLQKLPEYFSGLHNDTVLLMLERDERGNDTLVNEGESQLQQSRAVVDLNTGIVTFNAADFVSRGAAFRQQYGDFAYPHWTANKTYDVLIRMISFMPWLELSERTRWDV